MELDLLKLVCSNCGKKWIPKKEKIYRCPRCNAVLEQHPPEILVPDEPRIEKGVVRT